MIVTKTFVNFAVTINTYLLSLLLSKKSHHDPTGQIAAIRLPLFLPSSAVSCKKKDDHNLETQSQLPEKEKECSEFKFQPLYRQKLTVCVHSAVIYLPPASSRNSAEYYLSSLRLAPTSGYTF